MRRVDEVHLLPLCLSAGQCMLDNSVQHKVAESEHKYSNDLSDSVSNASSEVPRDRCLGLSQ